MKYISNRMMASSWNLWCEYIDPDATMPKAVFDEMTVEDRIGLIEAAFDDCRNGTIEADTYEAWIDGARDDSVIFSVYPGEDIVEAGASALGVCVSEALNTRRVTA